MGIVAGAGREREGALRPFRRQARLALGREDGAHAQRGEGPEYAVAVAVGQDAQLHPLDAVDEGDGRGEGRELGDDEPPLVRLHVGADRDVGGAIIRLLG